MDGGKITEERVFYLNRITHIILVNSNLRNDKYGSH